jgi:hypothetical protein
LAGFDDKFEGKFHARAAEVQSVEKISAKTSHAAITIPDSGSKQKVYEPTQTGIAQVFVQFGHGARFDATPEAVPHDQIVALTQFLDKIRYFAEVVAIIGIAHDDVLASRTDNPGPQRRAVTSLLDANHASSIGFGDFD